MLRSVRDDLHRIIRGEADASALQRHLDGASGRPVIDGDVVMWRPDVAGTAAMGLTLVLAWTDLVTRFPGRVRRCASTDHINRLKARRHSVRASEGKVTGAHSPT
ncbi:hypothetical protein [Aeromicrobium endophyticum]|uniref:Uncharacterized protein n=1 Tax=Aeromicrobium endophyticum TaxID=2292704 RepID=A0A371PCC9_9ACTN|nr:hypothetical protein [Aeromicrobium endophyticum]REK73611.1 hypothetical protein DX116_08775 [Aeromicrobium endophyticum]